MTVSFHKFGDLFFPGTGDVKVTFHTLVYLLSIRNGDFIFGIFIGTHDLVSFSVGLSGSDLVTWKSLNA